MSDDINVLFEQLLEFQWKGVAFPTSKFTLRLRHDLAQHKYPDKDGANVENTGRAPYQITASIPFLNGAVPGKGETWELGLYPFQYRKFMTVSALRKRGVLQHPEFGEIACQLESCETVWDATRRDGVIVECSWIETIIPGDDTDFVNSRPSPIASILLSALDLDAQMRDATPPFPSTPIFVPDFSTFVRSLTAFSDQISLAGKRISGKIDALTYRLNALETSIDNAQSTPKDTVKKIISPDTTRAAVRCLDWPIRNTIGQMRSALRDTTSVLGANGNGVKVYVTQIPMTLAAIAQSLGAPVADLLALNPESCGQPILPAPTRIRYYENANARAFGQATRRAA